MGRPRPLAIDLFAGLAGWSAGLIDAGFHVVGFDIEDMFKVVGEEKPEHFSLVLQDVMTLHGSQFKDAHLIVASPPCQEFSYMAMPWSLAKAKAEAIRADETGEAMRKLTALVDACHRIQREASEAAGRRIPMVFENVRGAIPWIGRSKYAFGSYHIWGDVPALMPAPVKATKIPGFRFDGSGRSFQTAAVGVSEGAKMPGHSMNKGAPKWNTHHADSVERVEGLKHGGDWFSDPSSPSRQGGQLKAKVVAEGRKGAGAGAEWFDGNLCVKSSNSPARKAASAKIAKIPRVLSAWIGKTYFPHEETCDA